MALELTIDELPDEVLEFVFLKLTLPEHKTVRLVCKHWLQVCNGARITRHELVRVKLRELHLFKTPRGCLNIEIDGQKYPLTNFKHEQFWVEHGDSVRFLKLIIFDKHSWIVHSVINHCCNVKNFILEFLYDSYVTVFVYYDDGDNYEDVKFVNDNDHVINEDAKLHSLVSLTLKCHEPTKFCPRTSFFRLTESVPNLKRLELIGFQKQNILIEVYVFSFIMNQALTLTELGFKKCIFATNSFLEAVCEEIGPQLTGLYLEALPLQSLNCFSKHADKLVNLKNIELVQIGWGWDGRDSLCELLHFPKLEFISILFSNFCEDNIISLVELEHLKGLEIGGSSKIFTTAGILNCFGKKMLPNLIALKILNLDCVTDDVLTTILPNLPYLKFFDVSNCGNISTGGLQAIVTNCEQLTHLSLAGCPRIENVAGSVRIDGLKQLVFINLARLPQFRPPDFSSLTRLRFDNLKTLVVANASEYQEELKEFYRNCPKLTRIFFDYAILERLNYSDIVRRSGNYRRDRQYFTIFDFCK